MFYLRYHGYRWYFPLLALARYRNLRRGNARKGGVWVLKGSSESRCPLPLTPSRKGRWSVGIVVGLAAEARIARRLGWKVAIGGGAAAGAEAAARRLIDEGSDALVSFGLAGALDPALRPGALIVPVSSDCR